MALGRLWRSTLGLIFFAAILPTAVAAVATEYTATPTTVERYAADCQGEQPTGVILYQEPPSASSVLSTELVAIDTNGNELSRFSFAEIVQVFPAWVDSKAFVTTKDDEFFLIDAAKGTSIPIQVTSERQLFPYDLRPPFVFTNLVHRPASPTRWQVLHVD